MNIKQPLLILLFLLCKFTLFGQIVINEVCSYNGSNIKDESYKVQDWIEIFNKDSNIVNLQGYGIENHKGDRWIFPNVSIQGKGFLLLFASGQNKVNTVLHTSFKIAKEGDEIRLYNNSNGIIDKISFGNLQLNHTIGRLPDGSDSIRIFINSSPNLSNNTNEGFLSYADNPVFSSESRFYSAATHLILSSNTLNATIYFTIDGSIPDTNSNKYISSLFIDSTLVIKARTFNKSKSVLPSEVITNTFFINYKSTLPVFSISTNPANLWDWNYGIYVLGPNANINYPYYGANFWQDWEIPAHIEYYETDQKLVLKQDAGLSINGGSVSRTRPMQSLRITARNLYGDNDLTYRFFEEKNIRNFKNIVLRNSSLDFNKTHFRDGSLHKLMLGNLNIDLLAYKPAVVFLNGKYWGIHNIRERFSKHYIEENCKYDEDKVDLLEEDTAVIEGNCNDFNQMLQFVITSPMNVKATYDSATTLIDIENLCDYFIAETFLSNTDWPYNNIKYWKSHNPNSKWRYMLMDLDVSLGNYGWAPAKFDLLGLIMSSYGDTNKHVQILKNLLKNNEFKTYFINRYADLVNTLFSTECMKQHIEKVMNTLETEMPFHFARWGSNTEAWHYETDNVVMPYLEERPAYALQFVGDTFDMKKQVEIELKVFPQNSGLIKLNTIKPNQLPWKGKYFDGNKVTIIAIPNAAYRFVQWQTSAMFIPNPKSDTIILNLDTNTCFTALFEQYLNENEIKIYPNPAKEVINLNFILSNEKVGNIHIYNATGKLIRNISFDGTEGLNSINIPIANLKEGLYVLKTETIDDIRTEKFIVIK